MQNGRKKKPTITLDHWYPVLRYAGAALAALIWPQLQETTWLMPGVMGSRRFLLIWIVLLLVINVMLDGSYIKAYRQDLDEIKRGVKNGGLHRQTLQAVASLCMFVLDAVVVAHYYLSFLNAGAVQADPVLSGYHTAALTAGMVLWIYGRALPKIKMGSLWGLKTKKSMASVQAWGSIHLKAVPWACGAGALILIAAAVLPPLPSIIVAAVCSVAAFVKMFMIKAE